MLESLNVEELNPRDDAEQATSVKELESIVLDDELPDRVVYIGSFLDVELREELIQFLKKNQDAFAWCHEDILGIDPRIMSQRLRVNLDILSVK